MQADDKFYITGDALSEEDYVNLTMLNFDEIAYDRLSDAILSRLALSSELYIATAALQELDRRGSPHAAQAAMDVLRSSAADGYLKALAFDVFFERDPMAAVDTVQPLLIREEDPVLASKVAEVLLNHAELSSQPAAQTLAKSVLESFQRFNASKPGRIDELLVSAIVRFGK